MRHSAKYNSVEKMMKIYVGVHDRDKELKTDNVYGVEIIKVVSDF